MNKAGIKELIRQGEGILTEFKECRNKLSKDVFESICAFLNRKGGDLLLGVNDRGNITGIDTEAVTENSNKPHGQSLIDPANFSPFPKNPIIARFFKEIGRADELGSGVRNLFKYCQHYSGGGSPELIEEDIFKCIVPLTAQVTAQVTEQVEKSNKILEFCKTPKSASEIMAFLGLKHREHFRAKIIQPLLKQGLLKPTIPDKPTSSKQKYYSNKEKK